MAKSKSPKPTASSDLKDELDKLCKDFEAGGPDLDSIETEEAAKEFVIDSYCQKTRSHDLGV